MFSILNWNKCWNKYVLHPTNKYCYGGAGSIIVDSTHCFPLASMCWTWYWIGNVLKHFLSISQYTLHPELATILSTQYILHTLDNTVCDMILYIQYVTQLPGNAYWRLQYTRPRGSNIYCQINIFRDRSCNMYWSTNIFLTSRANMYRASSTLVYAQSNTYCGSICRHDVCVNAYCSDHYVWGSLSIRYWLFSMLPNRGCNAYWLWQYDCLQYLQYILSCLNRHFLISIV